MIPIDNSAARRALHAATGRLVEFLRDVRAPDVPIPDSDWTIRQAAAHVVASLGDYGDSLAGVSELRATDPRLGPTNAQIRSVNAQRMSQVVDRDLGTLAGMIADSVARFLKGTEGHPGDEPYDWYGKRESSLAGMTGVMLGEVLLHGYDMARAARAKWPIHAGDATLVVLGALRLLPAYVDPAAARGVRASYEIALRKGPRVGVRFEDGSATVEHPPRAPFDCRLNADPVALLLVSYGRIGPWGPALRGKIVAWGRKPWLGISFAKMIMNP